MFASNMNYRIGVSHRTPSIITGTHFLNQVMSVTTLVRLTVNGHAVLVELEGKLQRLRPDATALVATGAQLMSKVVEHLEILHVVLDAKLWRMVELRFLPSEQSRSILVSELRGRPEKSASVRVRMLMRTNSPNDSLAEPLLHDLGLRSDSEDDGERKTVLARSQTAQLLAQSRRQHRDGTLHQVYAGCTLASVTVKGGIRLDEVRDVGNMDANFVRAVLVDLDGQSIVQVLRGIRINGEGTLPAEILAGLQLVVRDATAPGSASVACRHVTSTNLQGIGGKHLRTLSLNSSVGKLQSFRSALVSTSMSPMGPSSSTRVPKGWRELIG